MVYHQYFNAQRAESCIIILLRSLLNHRLRLRNLFALTIESEPHSPPRIAASIHNRTPSPLIQLDRRKLSRREDLQVARTHFSVAKLGLRAMLLLGLQTGSEGGRIRVLTRHTSRMGYAGIWQIAQGMPMTLRGSSRCGNSFNEATIE